MLADNPGFAPALVSLARAEAAKGNDEEAQTTLKSALSADPNDSSAAGELGLIEARRGAYDSALTHLKNAWAQNRMDAKITLELARVYLRLNQPGEALRVLAPLQPIAQDSPALHLELAQIYNQLQRTTDAEAERKRVTELQAQAQGMLHFESRKPMCIDRACVVIAWLLLARRCMRNAQAKKNFAQPTKSLEK